MTLRHFAEQIGFECSSPHSVFAADTTLAFAFDSGYLDPFKTLAFSLLFHQTLLDAPIVIYTDDPALLDDGTIRMLADKVVLLRGDRLQTLQNLAKHNVQRPERSAWNRGTFLKWSIFEPQETPRSVFMDVDMLALGGLEEGIRKHAVGDFSCVPQFQASLRTTGSGPKSETEVAQGLQQLLSGEFSGGHRSRVNSGLLVLSKNLCSNDFWDRIVGYAEARVDLSEQSFFSNYFKAHDSSYLHMMPAKLNFQETYCRILSLDKQKAILQKVSLLHFAGPGKPWKVAAASDVSYGQALWLLYDFNRRRYFS